MVDVPPSPSTFLQELTRIKVKRSNKKENIFFIKLLLKIDLRQLLNNHLCILNVSNIRIHLIFR